MGTIWPHSLNSFSPRIAVKKACWSLEALFRVLERLWSPQCPLSDPPKDTSWASASALHISSKRAAVALAGFAWSCIKETEMSLSTTRRTMLISGMKLDKSGRVPDLTFISALLLRRVPAALPSIRFSCWIRYCLALSRVACGISRHA